MMLGRIIEIMLHCVKTKESFFVTFCSFFISHKNQNIENKSPAILRMLQCSKNFNFPKQRPQHPANARGWCHQSGGYAPAPPANCRHRYP